MTVLAGPDPLLGLPTYAQLWNGDTKKPAGGIFISPIDSNIHPTRIGDGAPTDSIPTGQRSTAEGKPKYDGVWFYDCSSMSLPSFDFSRQDIKDGRVVTTKKGRIGHTMLEIIELIKKLLLTRCPVSLLDDKSINQALRLLKELKDKLRKIGITISLPTTPDGLKELCNIRSPWAERLRSIKNSLTEILKSSGKRNLNTIIRPWAPAPGFPGTSYGRDCKWVFLGYWKRGRMPDPTYGTPLSPPGSPGSMPFLELKIGVATRFEPVEIASITGTSELNNGKKYTLRNPKSILSLPWWNGPVGIGTVNPSLGMHITPPLPTGPFHK
jgi:hypothetical protein